jgi:uncharacterized damage-inducible protein DinB
MEQPARPPLEQSSRRLARTADDLVAAIGGQSEAALARRPDATNWAAKEIICHLRDTEELFMTRLEAISAMDEPVIPAAGMGARAMGLEPDGGPAAPDRWAEDRQYLRNDVGEALGAFRKRREETLAHLAALSPEQWLRGGIHPRRGRMTVGDFVREMAWHDDNHLDQLHRALDGTPAGSSNAS